jgi:DNA-directed RNA polymerase subunit M/transcription elongation factor TFIIS
MTQLECPECGNENLRKTTLSRLKTPDDEIAGIYRCLKCGYGWREYGIMEQQNDLPRC